MDATSPTAFAVKRSLQGASGYRGTDSSGRESVSANPVRLEVQPWNKVTGKRFASNG